MAHVLCNNRKYKRLDSIQFSHDTKRYYTFVEDEYGDERVVSKLPYGSWEFAKPLVLLKMEGQVKNK